MEERHLRLFMWSTILGFLGWLSWELNTERSKAERQIEEEQKRRFIQHKYRE